MWIHVTYYLDWQKHWSASLTQGVDEGIASPIQEDQKHAVGGNAIVLEKWHRRHGAFDVSECTDKFKRWEDERWEPVILVWRDPKRVREINICWHLLILGGHTGWKIPWFAKELHSHKWHVFLAFMQYRVNEWIRFQMLHPLKREGNPAKAPDLVPSQKVWGSIGSEWSMEVFYYIFLLEWSMEVFDYNCLLGVSYL